jgi:ankyrin repeat protein
MSASQLSQFALLKLLTIEEVQQATKIELEIHHDQEYSLLHMICCCCDDVELLEAILDKGVNIDDVTEFGWTSLQLSAERKKWDFVQVLLRRGADPSPVNSVCSISALHFAAIGCAPDNIIKSLLDTGADPKCQDFYGKNPADCAREKGNTLIASYIEEYCVPPTKSANLLI